jgi:hypothetical protein
MVIERAIQHYAETREGIEVFSVLKRSSVIKKSKTKKAEASRDHSIIKKIAGDFDFD